MVEPHGAIHVGDEAAEEPQREKAGLGRAFQLVTDDRSDEATGKPVKGFGDLKADGSTACGAWIYSGMFAPTVEHPDGHNHAANRNGDDWVALGWAFAWPANRRVMYNRASADPKGNPWLKESCLAGGAA